MTKTNSSFRSPARASIFALLAGLACGHLTDPPLPPDAVPFVPPSVYTRWWAMVESCSGVSRPMANVQWYAASSALRNPQNAAEPIEGYYSIASNRIVIGSNDTLDGAGVRHEMLHALVQVAGHPRSAFLQKCGGVVYCAAACVLDAGPAPPPDAATPRVALSDLEVTSAIFPADPSFSTESGMFTFTISVRNPFAYAVVALPPSPPGGGIPVGFQFDVRVTTGAGVVGGDLAYDNGLTYFAAGETKRHVIDFAVAPSGFEWFYGLPGLGESGIGFPPATYVFRGAYGDHWAADLSVALSP